MGPVCLSERQGFLLIYLAFPFFLFKCGDLSTRSCLYYQKWGILNWRFIFILKVDDYCLLYESFFLFNLQRFIKKQESFQRWLHFTLRLLGNNPSSTVPIWHFFLFLMKAGSCISNNACNRFFLVFDHNVYRHDYTSTWYQYSCFSVSGIRMCEDFS